MGKTDFGDDESIDLERVTMTKRRLDSWWKITEDT